MRGPCWPAQPFSSGQVSIEPSPLMASGSLIAQTPRLWGDWAPYLGSIAVMTVSVVVVTFRGC
jgi:hypothetical protein